MVLVSSVVNENDVPTHVSASGGGGAPAEGSSAEVSLRQGVWGRGLAGKIAGARGCIAEEMQKQKKIKKITRYNKMQKFFAFLNKGG